MCFQNSDMKGQPEYRQNFSAFVGINAAAPVVKCCKDRKSVLHERIAMSSANSLPS